MLLGLQWLCVPDVSIGLLRHIARQMHDLIVWCWFYLSIKPLIQQSYNLEKQLKIQNHRVFSWEFFISVSSCCGVMAYMNGACRSYVSTSTWMYFCCA